MDPREHAIEAAISDYSAGLYPSKRAAAKAYNLPESTLRSRLNGSTNSVASHQHQQRLSPEQEEFLVEWILEEDARACPPPHARAREMANRILRMNGDPNPVGKLWLSHFLRRNPRVASVVGKKIEAQRAEAATPEQVRAFLELFERTRQRLNIPMEDVYNMDETGIALGVCTNTRVLASSSKKKAYIKSPENREWVSIVECVSATGQRLRCVVIFKGQSLQTTWFSSKLGPDWLYTTSQNGWTSNAIGKRWLRRIFLPETTRPEAKHRLLIVDGHGSHIDVDFQWLCKQNQIELLYLPPHSSHILQPLDLAPFSVVKSNYRNQIRALASLDDAAPVKKERFVQCYNMARDQGLTERVIRAGWRATGICPLNIGMVVGSSQVQQRPSTPEHRKQPLSLIDTLYTTPQKPQDFYLAQQRLQRSENLTRTTRIVLQKAGKALSAANTRAAGLEEKNRRLEHQLEAISPTRPRKRIRIDPNEQFANIGDIMSAINQSAAEQAQRSRTTAAEAAERAAIAAAAATLESMCNSWQLSM
jgi:hypothetical protein